MKVLIVGAWQEEQAQQPDFAEMMKTHRLSLFERGQYISYANCGLPYYVGRSDHR